VFCQLETLRYCLPPSVRHTLDELPESLDETYERVLKEIKKPNRNHARRLLQCLVVAIRPLGVKELAEVLAVDFGDAEGIPKLNSNWRWEDQEQALLTSCSSLITIVETGYSRVVQFSHFSVKEFLTSARLATSSADVSRYHIVLEPAHTILAHACMSVLLQPDDHADENSENGVGKKSPLAGYAARHWVTHAQFDSVSSFLRKAMEDLFDLDKPYFAAWLQLHDIDTDPYSQSSPFHWFTYSTKSSDSRGTPVYYAALCGFQDLVEHLVLKYPQHVNARGGYYVTPLVAALAGEHFQTARILVDNGAHPNVRGDGERTPLHAAAHFGDFQMMQVLLEYKADVNARSALGKTPLHYVSRCARTGPNLSELESPDISARYLLEHGADINARAHDDSTPLHKAARYRRVEVVRVLLEHGATVGAEDMWGRTPFQVASLGEHSGIIKLLSEYGAK
jgi:hypothetical protein